MVEELKKESKILTMEQVQALFDFGDGTVKKLFNQEDFPAIRVGKTNLVLYEPLMHYFSVRRDLRGN